MKSFVRFICDGCSTAIKAPAKARGKSSPCPKCGKVLRVPVADELISEIEDFLCQKQIPPTPPSVDPVLTPTIDDPIPTTTIPEAPRTHFTGYCRRCQIVKPRNSDICHKCKKIEQKEAELERVLRESEALTEKYQHRPIVSKPVQKYPMSDATAMIIVGVLLVLLFVVVVASKVNGVDLGGGSSSGGTKDVSVKGYYRSNGSYVAPHHRSRPGH